MGEELKRQIQSRGGHRAKLTILTKTADGYIRNFSSLSQADQDKLESTMDNIQAKIQLLKELDQSILKLMPVETIEKSVVEFDDYITDAQDDYFLLKKRLERSRSDPDKGSLSKHGKPASTSNIRLPKLSLETFEGNILKWQSFHDGFCAAIDKNPTLEEVQKFQYLQGQLKGEAAKAIQGLELTNSNYRHALDILRKRYGQSHKIVAANMNGLLQLPRTTSDPRTLRHFYDTIESHVRSLQSLGKSESSYGDLLVPIVWDRLPESTRQQLARGHGSTEWTLSALCNALLQEIEALEAGQLTNLNTSACCSETNDPEPMTTASFHTDVKSTRKPHCVFCAGTHYPGDCTVFAKPADRLEQTKKLQLCFNCLGRHKVRDCKSKFKCRQCKKKHHTALCSTRTQQNPPVTPNNGKSKADDSTPSKQSGQEQVQSVLTNEVNVHHIKSGPVLLKTAVTEVSSPTTTCEATILFDEGSTRSFITADLAGKLKAIPTGAQTLTLTTFGDKPNSARKFEEVRFFIHTICGERKEMSALVVPYISTMTNRIDSSLLSLPHLKGLRFAHPRSNMDSFEITILIGADFFWDFVEDHVIRGPGPTAVRSQLGFLLSGPLNSSNKETHATSLFVMDSDQEAIHYKQYCDLETLGIKENPCASDGDTDPYQSYCDTHLHYDGTRYVAKLPWKSDHDPLPTNYDVCVKRTQATIRRLTPELRHAYNSILQDYTKRGFIEVIEEDDVTSGHYLPHRAVLRHDSTTTPIRIVFDCSCKTGDSPSLNDCLETGPPLQNDLPAILMRFRCHQHAFTADIEKAFLNVGLAEDDRKFTKFLWLSDPDNPSSDLRVYQFKVVLFGAVSSPFILNATVRSHLDSDDSHTAKDMQRNIYVDNVASGMETESETVDYYNNSRTLMQRAGFNLRSWASNCPAVNNCATKDGVLSPGTTANVLGISWDTVNDTLQYAKCNHDHFCPGSFLTKREVTSAISSIYDPLGYLTPVHVKGKVFLQEIWKKGFSWDEPLPDDLVRSWADISQELVAASKASVIPRKFFGAGECVGEPYELHVFADASMKAYGAVAFLVRGSEVAIVMAKSRVVPMNKLITMPRLELLAALVGARLLAYVHNSLKPCVNIKTSVLWSDSQIVISWIHSGKPLPTYVTNRIKEIRSYSMIDQIRYCPTKDNPADFITRGLTAERFQNATLWWKGPEWIRSRIWSENDSSLDSMNSLSHSDMEHVTSSSETTGPELVTVVNESAELQDISSIVHLDRFSSYTRLLRVSAYVLRFVSNLRNRSERRQVGPLTASEIQSAELVWLKAMQNRSFQAEIQALKESDLKGPIVKQLRLFIDDKGLLRVGGRLHNAELPDDAKFPILIPSKHQFTKLVILRAHSTVLHAGLQSTIVNIRKRFWITNIRQRVKSLLRDCVICKRVIGKPFRSPIPAPLQSKRLLMAPPFTVSGVDFSGALSVRSEGGTPAKAYLCLFTCAVTRAVHLEIVSDLTVASFISALRRFAARRSMPKEIISDNASTFQSASDELKTFFANHGVKWTFIKKRAAWFGGFYERLIGLTKSVLKKVLGRSFLSLEELQTVVTEIEAVLNDRPITFQSSEVDDLEPLTPSHFLHGRLLTTSSLPLHDLDLDELTDPSYGFTQSVMHRRVLYMAKLQAEFWKRWTHEYLAALRERHLVTGKGVLQNQIKVGDIVLIQEDNLPRVRWRMGKVIQLHYGNDGLVRSVSLKTAKGYTNRPIVKLCHLESSFEPHSESETTTVSNQTTERPKREAFEIARQRIAQMV